MVRVLIERHIAEGMIEDFRLALRNMRGSAISKEGYISGESLHDEEDPHHYFVISTWRSAQDWHKWHESEDRQRIMAAILPMMDDQEHITVLAPV